MKILIKNLAKIEHAEVELAGVTCIAGENNTGKSSVGKALYSLITAVSNIDEKIENERFNAVRSSIVSRFTELGKLQPTAAPRERARERTAAKRIANIITEHYAKESYNKDLINNDSNIVKLLNEIGVAPEDVLLNDECDLKLQEIFLTDSGKIIKKIIGEYFQAEFRDRLNHVNYSGETVSISLENGNKIVGVSIKDNIVDDYEITHVINEKVVYIDDPFILSQIRLDDLYPFPAKEHSVELVECLNESRDEEGQIIGSIMAEEKIARIMSKINEAAGGEFGTDGFERLTFRENGLKDFLPVDVLSTGLKSFVIIKRLLETGAIREGGYLVLDEPEVHLHPKWQLTFAELIIMIAKEFDIKVLLTTHSPYFLYAIEVFSAKQDFADRCRYYCAEEKGDRAVIEDVTTNISAIYDKLATPMQTLEDLRYR